MVLVQAELSQVWQIVKSVPKIRYLSEFWQFYQLRDWPTCQYVRSHCVTNLSVLNVALLKYEIILVFAQILISTVDIFGINLFESVVFIATCKAVFCYMFDFPPRESQMSDVFLSVAL